jgi:tungstate transport system ATP-binding protein
MSLYQLHHIQHRYNDRPVLTIDQLQIPFNSVIGLAGPNGSGKSTLLRLLGFVERPGQGQIRFDHHKTDLFSAGLRTQVALLPQQSYLLKRSVYKNVAYGLRIRSDRRDENRRIHEALRWVGLDARKFSRRPWFALSGGEARRVALAARLVLRPRVILLDEPTISVDAASAHIIKESILRARQQWDTTLIISSHDMEWLNDISDRIIYIFRGHVMSGGQPTVVFGPWESGRDDTAYRTIIENERFEAAHPPENLQDAAAAIDAGDMTLHFEENVVPAGLHRIKGRLAHLSFEKKSGCIGVTVTAGSLTFHISVQPANESGRHWIPGQTVWIGYDPKAVRWME